MWQLPGTPPCPSWRVRSQIRLCCLSVFSLFVLPAGSLRATCPPQGLLGARLKTDPLGKHSPASAKVSPAWPQPHRHQRCARGVSPLNLALLLQELQSLFTSLCPIQWSLSWGGILRYWGIPVPSSTMVWHTASSFCSYNRKDGC